MINIELISPTKNAAVVRSVNGMTGEVIIEIPSIEGLATEKYVQAAIEAIDVDMTGVATEEYVAKKIAEAQLAGADVDLSAYYTKSEVDAKIADIDIPDPDLSDYVTNAFVTEELVPAINDALEQKADKSYVDEQIAALGGGEDNPREDVSSWYDENGARPVFDETFGMLRVELPGFDFNGDDWIGTDLNYDIVCEGNGERKEERDKDWARVWTEPDNHHLCDFYILGENYSNEVRIHEGSLYAESFPEDFVIYELIIYKPGQAGNEDNEEYVTYDYINNDLIPLVENMIEESTGGAKRVDNYHWSSEEPLTAERNPDIENYFTLQLPDFPEGLEGAKKYEIVCEGDGERKEEFGKDWADAECTPDGIALYNFDILGDNYGEAAILPGGILVMSNVPEDFRLYEFNIYTLERTEYATIDSVNDLAARIEALENTPNAEEGLY